MVSDHLVDAVDRGGDVELQLRSGATRQIESGSWLVNCTGYVFGEQSQHRAYEPYMSADGNVGVVSTRAAIALLPSFGGYYLGHLMMLGQLGELPLYELDGDELARQSREAWACAAVTVNLYNLSVIADNTPREVLSQNGLNLDLWFPRTDTSSAPCSSRAHPGVSASIGGCRSTAYRSASTCAAARSSKSVRLCRRGKHRKALRNQVAFVAADKAMAAFIGCGCVGSVVDRDGVVLGDLGRSRQKGARRHQDASIGGEPVDRRKQRRRELRRAPGPHRDIGDLVASEVQRGKAGRLAFQQCP